MGDEAIGSWRARVKTRVQDSLMRFVDELRPQTVTQASGRVLEVGFGTGRNLEHYGPGVERLVALDPLDTRGASVVEQRILRARFPVERAITAASGELPFDSASFDCVLTTWTLCSIRGPLATLAEMRRVLKPGGRYLFVEHGRAPTPRLARWQERVNPLWCRVMDGCNLDRPIDGLVEDAGFSLVALERFRHRGPALLAHMYRGVAVPR